MEVPMVVVGDGAVGKSSLTLQYIQNIFVDFYDPTIEDFYRKQVEIDGEVALLNVLDTAGQEAFAGMRDLWVRSGKCFLLVYSITSRRSFDYVAQFYTDLLRIKDAGVGDVPVMLLGNKSDLGGEREVTVEEAQRKAEELRCPFLEASAKLRLNVNEGFEMLVREYRNWLESKRETQNKARVKVLFARSSCSIL
eukprot:CAMPEP_0119322986 /NCGR_PEP_ID=MMETSP1333-20130426/59672_1 /TAXON_ID=418940 /ORGANISM="Scyphosphaera apsteinii, Strain RCC1455" /LENGTH=193 /DNA_ID=CAMNT_0007330337 /DNA_START=16 /DNA_END=597 /DNA_ORIENTATION=-